MILLQAISSASNVYLLIFHQLYSIYREALYNVPIIIMMMTLLMIMMIMMIIIIIIIIIIM